jgi:hypothetical protein
MCNNSEVIVGYLYGELPEQSRTDLEAHLSVCDACRGEVAALRATRGVLTAWAPPEPDFAFRIVRESQTPPHRRFGFTPVWGFAAAAVLVLAAAAAIANVEVRYDSTGLVVRTGWAPHASEAVPVPGGIVATGLVAPGAQPMSAVQIAALDKRLAQLEEQARQAASGVQTAAGPRISDEEILRRVREIVRQSETRQQREMALQIAQVVRDVDRARVMDVQATRSAILGQMRGATSAEIASQLNQLLRVSQQR